MKNAAFQRSALIYILVVITALSVYADELLVYSFPEAQANPPLIERHRERAPYREIVPLNGQWNLIHPKSGAFLGNVRLPFAYQSRQQLLLEKPLTLRRDPKRDYRLHIGSAVGDVEIWWNDSLLYRGDRNYLPISIKLENRHIANSDTIRMMVKGQDRRRGDLPGFYPVNMPRVDYGILDAIYIESLPRRYLQQLDISATITGDTTFFGGSAIITPALPDTLDYRLRLRCLRGITVLWEKTLPVKTSGTPFMTLPLLALPRLAAWHPEQPLSAHIEATLDSAGQVLDMLRVPLAMRHSTIIDNQFRWNQQALVLNGINYIYQSREGATLFDPELLRQDLMDIKSLGFNALRVVLHPLPEWFYQICDELGLLVFQDLPFSLWGQGDGTQQEALLHWNDHLVNLADLSRRYSCIAAAGLSFYPNLQSTPQRDLLKVLADGFRTHSKLPIYIATLLPVGGTGQVIDFQLVDVPGGWNALQNYERTETILKPQLFYPSAFSKALTLRVDSSFIVQDLRLKREFGRQIKQEDKAPSGNFLHTYSDFYLQLPSIQNGSQSDYYLNRLGLVDMGRQARDLETLRQQEFSTNSPVGKIREDRGSHSFLYIIFGLLNIFVFLATFSRYKVFRQSLGYSLKKPHGFFISLQERIIIPYKQSFFILLVISLNGALIYSAVFYFYRHHLMLDYLISLLFYSPAIKEIIVRLVWDQALFFITVTIIIALFFYLLAFVIKLIALITRVRVLYYQALAVTIWAASPFVFLLPLGVLMYSLLMMTKTYWIIYGGLLYFHVWAYLRWINGVRVLTDRLYSQVFTGFTLILLLFLAGCGYLYESQYHVVEHLQYLYALQAFWQ